MSVKTYKCPNCDAPLIYSGSKNKMVCEFCDGEFDLDFLEKSIDGEVKEEVEDIEGANEVDETIVFGGSRAEDSGSWTLNDQTLDWGTDPENLSTFSCPTCGAGLICEATTAATSCPFCGNPAILPGKFNGQLKPNYVIPFKIDQNRARALLEEYYKGKPLLPAPFKTENHIKELKGIYVPFWLYSGTVSGDARYEAIIEYITETSTHRIIKKRHYDVYREGSLAFEKVPADASEKMPDDVMDSLEPFDYSELTDFNTAVLSGYLADISDVSQEADAERVDLRCRNSFQQALRNTVSGYTSVYVKDQYSAIERGGVDYALFPVYMLRTHWQEKDFIFAINGQTGKVVGNLPVHAGKAFLFGMIGFGIAAVVTWFISGFFV